MFRETFGQLVRLGVPSYTQSAAGEGSPASHYTFPLNPNDRCEWNKQRRKDVWWEEVLLQVVEKGKKPYTLPNPPDDACVLVPSVNQTLLQKGITVDQVRLYPDLVNCDALLEQCLIDRRD